MTARDEEGGFIQPWPMSLLFERVQEYVRPHIKCAAKACLFAADNPFGTLVQAVWTCAFCFFHSTE